MAKAAKKAVAKKDGNGVRGAAKVYKLNKKIPEEGLPPQMKTILEVVEGAGGEITRGDLLKKLEGKLKTEQTPVKILSFYRRRLIDDGFLREKVAEKAAA